MKHEITTEDLERCGCELVTFHVVDGNTVNHLVAYDVRGRRVARYVDRWVAETNWPWASKPRFRVKAISRGNE